MRAGSYSVTILLKREAVQGQDIASSKLRASVLLGKPCYFIYTFSVYTLHVICTVLVLVTHTI